NSLHRANCLALGLAISFLASTLAGCSQGGQQSAKEDQKSTAANAPSLTADDEFKDATGSPDEQRPADLRAAPNVAPEVSSAEAGKQAEQVVPGSNSATSNTGPESARPSATPVRSLSDVIDSVDDGVVLVTTQDALKRDTGSGSAFVID